MSVLTTGAGDDLEKATDMARKMICEWGMSEQLGPLTYGKKEEQIFLGREIAQHQDYSESTAVIIDQEVKREVLQAYERAREVLRENRDALIRVAEALLEYEVLDGDEVAALVKGQDVAALVAGKRERRTRANTAASEPIRPVADKGKGDLASPGIAPDPIKQPS